MRGARGFAEAETRKGCVICRELDPRLQFDGGFVAVAGKILDSLHQSSADALALKPEFDGELADIEIIGSLQRKNAACDLAALQSHEHRFPPSLVPQAFDAQ